VKDILQPWKEITMTDASVTQAQPEVRIVKTATCASVSGKSQIKYDVGCAPDAEIHLRISANTGNGAFSQEWVPLRAVRKAFAGASPGEITSHHLRELYAGRSVNTPPFLLAALVNEGLLLPSKSKRRCYECADDAVFLAAAQVWRSADAGGGGEVVDAKESKRHTKGKQGRAGKAALPDVTEGGTSEGTQSSPPATKESVPSPSAVKRLPTGKKSAPRKVKGKRSR